MYHQGREFVRYIKSVPNAICVKRYTVKNDAVIIINERMKIEKNYIKIQKSNIVNGNNNNIKKARNNENDNDKANDIKNTAIICRRGEGEGGRGRGKGEGRRVEGGRGEVKKDRRGSGGFWLFPY